MVKAEVKNTGPEQKCAKNHGQVGRNERKCGSDDSCRYYKSVNPTGREMAGQSAHEKPQGDGNRERTGPVTEDGDYEFST